MKEYYCGQKESFSKTITEYDVYQFAGITGDFNSVHIDKTAAENSLFGKRIAHGCLTSSFISTVLGMKLPGPGTIYLSQEVKYLKPVYLEDTITAVVEIVEINGSKARLKTQIFNQNGECVVDGMASVKLPV